MRRKLFFFRFGSSILVQCTCAHTNVESHGEQHRARSLSNAHVPIFRLPRKSQAHRKNGWGHTHLGGEVGWCRSGGARGAHGEHLPALHCLDGSPNTTWAWRKRATAGWPDLCGQGCPRQGWPPRTGGVTDCQNTSPPKDMGR